MAKIEAILKISDDEVNGEIDVATSSTYGNNISSYPYSYSILDFINNMSVDNKSFSGARVTPIQTTPSISALRFGSQTSDGVRHDTYNGMLLGISDSNNNYVLTLSLTGSDIIGVEFYFDSYIGQYPTEYTYTNTSGTTTSVSGNTSNKITISGMPAGSGTFSITFTKWSLSNTIIGLTFIGFQTETIKLTKAQIVSFESQSQIITSTSGLNYGVVANTGKINIDDNNIKNPKETLYEKAKLGYLNAYLFTLDLQVNSKSIQTHISTNSPLYTSDRKITLELSDVLSLWDNIVVPSKVFYSGETYYDVVTYLANYFSSIDVPTMCSDYCVMGNIDIVSTRVEFSISTYLQQITFVGNVTLNEGTLREQFEKICTCAQLSIYINRNNEIKFMSARPVYMYEQRGKEINIPYSKQISRPNYDILVANRYEDVEFK